MKAPKIMPSPSSEAEILSTVLATLPALRSVKLPGTFLSFLKSLHVEINSIRSASVAATPPSAPTQKTS